MVKYKVFNDYRLSYLIKGYGWLGQGQECITNIRPNSGRGLSYEIIGEGTVETVETEYPTTRWTEKKIKRWVSENAKDVRYDIRNDSKMDVLLRLEHQGYIKTIN